LPRLGDASPPAVCPQAFPLGLGTTLPGTKRFRRVQLLPRLERLVARRFLCSQPLRDPPACLFSRQLLALGLVKAVGLACDFGFRCGTGLHWCPFGLCVNFGRRFTLGGLWLVKLGLSPPRFVEPFVGRVGRVGLVIRDLRPLRCRRHACVCAVTPCASAIERLHGPLTRARFRTRRVGHSKAGNRHAAVSWPRLRRGYGPPRDSIRSLVRASCHQQRRLLDFHV